MFVKLVKVLDVKETCEKILDGIIADYVKKGILTIADNDGKETDISIMANELISTRRIIAGLIAKRCGKDKKQVEKDIENDKYMNAQQAFEYGICDKIIKE